MILSMLNVEAGRETLGEEQDSRDGVSQQYVQQRAGYYQLQPTGYSAFIPAPLPPDPPLDISGVLQQRLSDADLALGRLDGSIQSLPAADLFVFMYVRKEAVLSSQIEGTQSSLQDVLSAEARIASPHRPDDAFEVINYIQAMKYGLERLSELPVSIRLVREIHQRLLAGVRGSKLTPGELRTEQNWIGSQNSTISTTEFVPPPPAQVLSLLGEWEQFLHHQNGLPFLIRLGLIHAHFETIHPFLDGNGRIGRLLITFLLCEREILLKPVLYLSYFFKVHRSQYYALLQGVRDKGDWESWLAFFLQGIAEVSVEATATVRRIVSLADEHRSMISNRMGRLAGNGHRLLGDLFRQPYIMVKDVQKTLGVSYPSANDLVSRLVDIGILSDVTGRRRNRVFFYEPYISIFDT